MKPPINLPDIVPGDIITGLHKDGVVYANALVFEGVGGLYITHVDGEDEFDMPLKEFQWIIIQGSNEEPTLPVTEGVTLEGDFWEDGEPCNHVGCVQHVTHPCEGCGRIFARGRVDKFSLT